MSSEVEGKLRKLLIYYGENPDSPDAPKPEEFFGLILSFSASLQVSVGDLHPSDTLIDALPQKVSLEVHDAQAKLEAPKVMPVEEETSEDKTPESVCFVISNHDLSADTYYRLSRETNNHRPRVRGSCRPQDHKEGLWVATWIKV
ncbi:hypothetical protein MPER_04424 [Moniliophthora perniciosa FA553]|nr:hypothetical protein MPER_04424 [Moniliophthora perniciosa FA553]